MEALRKALAERVAGKGVTKVLLAHGEEELLVLHGPEVEVLDSPHGHGKHVLLEGEIQERAGGDNVPGGQLFAEVPKGGEHRGGRLDLVEEEQGRSGRDGLFETRLEQAQDRGGGLGGEEGCRVRCLFEIDLHEVGELLLREHPDKEGLPRLARAAHDEGLARGVALPLLQVVQREAMHGELRHDWRESWLIITWKWRLSRAKRDDFWGRAGVCGGRRLADLCGRLSHRPSRSRGPHICDRVDGCRVQWTRRRGYAESSRESSRRKGTHVGPSTCRFPTRTLKGISNLCRTPQGPPKRKDAGLSEGKSRSLIPFRHTLHE